MKTEQKTLEDRLLDLEAGEGIDYGLLEEIEQSGIGVSVVCHYTDMQGFLETWRIGDDARIVVDGLNGRPIIRRVSDMVEELTDR